jgi:hypothetical protein
MIDQDLQLEDLFIEKRDPTGPDVSIGKPHAQFIAY